MSSENTDEAFYYCQLQKSHEFLIKTLNLRHLECPSIKEEYEKEGFKIPVSNGTKDGLLIEIPKSGLSSFQTTIDCIDKAIQKADEDTLSFIAYTFYGAAIKNIHQCITGNLNLVKDATSEYIKEVSHYQTPHKRLYLLYFIPVPYTKRYILNENSQGTKNTPKATPNPKRSISHFIACYKMTSAIPLAIRAYSKDQLIAEVDQLEQRIDEHNKKISENTEDLNDFDQLTSNIEADLKRTKELKTETLDSIAEVTKYRADNARLTYAKQGWFISGMCLLLALYLGLRELFPKSSYHLVEIHRSIQNIESRTKLITEPAIEFLKGREGSGEGALDTLNSISTNLNNLNALIFDPSDSEKGILPQLYKLSIALDSLNDPNAEQNRAIIESIECAQEAVTSSINNIKIKLSDPKNSKLLGKLNALNRNLTSIDTKLCELVSATNNQDPSKVVGQLTDLNKQINNLESSISELKKSIDEAVPTQLINEGDNNSRSKRGFFNWF